MDRLSSAIDILVDEACNGLLKPKHLRKVAKECGLEFTKEEANEIISEIVTLFRARFRSGIDEIVEDVEIEQKLEDLKVLADECKAKCHGLGETVGYRSLGMMRESGDGPERIITLSYLSVDRDLQGAVHPVVSGYREALTIFNSTLKEDTKIAREELKRIQEEVNTLAKQSESLMARRYEEELEMTRKGLRRSPPMRINSLES